MPTKKNPATNDKAPEKSAEEDSFYLVAVGASAGGLEALREFLLHYPTDLTNTSIIIAQHLDPSHKSMMAHLLSSETNMQVIEAVDGAELKPNMVYIAPPNSDITVAKNKIQLTSPHNQTSSKPSVDILFTSAAVAFKNRAIAIVLSGTIDDGSEGIIAISKAGGYVLAQSAATAKFNNMPHAAIETKLVDEVLAPKDMGQAIARYIKHPNEVVSEAHKELTNSPAWNSIFKLLLKTKGVDFSHYKTPTINRRLGKRLSFLQINTPEAYYDYLVENPRELEELYSIFLIKVTNFFRDKEAFEALEHNLKNIISEKNEGDTIRIWIVACASGEEAYSIAMLVCEILKEKITDYNIQIFATDVDEKVIQFARRAIYTDRIKEEVPPDLLQKYFIETPKGFEPVKEIRNLVLFSRHDIISNPPFLKLDFISCRNLLIYFDQDLQKKIFPVFHYALNMKGILFLGKSETILSQPEIFEALDAKNRIFQRKFNSVNSLLRFSSYITTLRPKTPIGKLVSPSPPSIKELVKETLFNSYENAYVVINSQYEVIEINGDVRPYLSLNQGTMNNSIVKLANPDLQMELRSLISHCIKEHQQVKSTVRKFELFGSIHYVRMTARPTIGNFEGEEFYIVIFEKLEKKEIVEEVSQQKSKDNYAQVVLELEQELLAAKLHLQIYIEELETANEELQFSNEELQSLDEESQSTNEELRSTNEELVTATEELQITYTELNNAYQSLEEKEEKIRENDANLHALLNNTLQIFVLLDPSYKIVAHNKLAAATFKSIFNKSISDGASIIDFTPSQKIDLFLRNFKEALAGEIVAGEGSVMDVKGNLLWFQYNYTPIITDAGLVTSVSMSMLDITESKTLAAELQTGKLLSSVFNSTSIGIAVIDEAGFFVDVNQEFCSLYGYERNELIGKEHYLLIAIPDREKAHQLHLDFIGGKVKESGAETVALKKDGIRFEIYTSSELLLQDDGKRYKVKSVRDITLEKNAIRTIEAGQIKYRAMLDNSMPAFFLTTPDGDILESNKAARDIFGYSEDEFLQMGRQGFVEHDKIFIQSLKEREEKGFATGLVYCIKKNGERITCEFSSVTFNDINSEKRNSTIMMDVSERKKMEKLLDETNQMAKVGSWEVDVINNKVYWSPVTRQIHEVGDNFIPEVETAINFYKEGKSRYLIGEAVKDGMEKQLPWDEELQIVTALGNERWVRVSGKPEFEGEKLVRLYGSFQDITDNKLVALELERSRQEYQSLFEQNPNAVISLRLGGNFFKVNDVAASIAETTIDALLQQNFIEYIHPDDTKSVLENFESVKSGTSKTHNTKIITAKGNLKHLHVTSMPIIVDSEIVGVSSILSDITREKASEEELLFQSHLINAIKQAVIVTNLEGTITYWNDYAEFLYGWKTEEVMGRNIIDVTSNDLSKEDAIAIMETLGRGENWTGSFPVKNKGGDLFTAYINNSPILDASGKLTGIIGVSWDITKELESQDYIKFQAGLLDTVKQAVVASLLDGTIYYWNHYAEVLYGWSKEEAIGKNANMMVSKDPCYSQLADELMNQFNQGKSWAGEFTVLNKQGISFPVFSVNSPIYNSNQELTGIIAVSYDISARVAAAQQKEFERLDKEALINSTSDLIWSVSKDFKLIAANKAFVDLMKMYTGKDIKPGDGLHDPADIPVEYIEIWQKQYSRGLAGESFTFEFYTPEEAGMKEAWSETTINPIANNEEVIGIACHCRNITDRKLFQKTLLDINVKLETAQQIAKLGYWERDLKTNSFFWSEQTRKILNLPENITSSSFESLMEIIHPDDKQRVLDSATVDNVELSNSIEYRIILNDNTEKNIESIRSLIKHENGLPVRIEGTLQDITERKLIEEAIRESEERFRIMFSKAPLGMALIDSLNGDVYDANERFGAITGRTIDELKKIDWMQITHPDDVQEDLDNMKLLNEKKIPGFTLQKRYIRPDKSIVWIQMSIAPVDSKDALHPKHLCMVEDITERRAAEQTIQLSNERFNMVSKATNDAIWDWDMVTGNVTRTGTGMENMFGYNSDEASADNNFWFSKVHPEDLEKVLSRREIIFSEVNNTFWEGDYRFLKANGQYAYVNDKGFIIRDEAGRAVRMIGALQDISHRKEAELMLKDLNEQLEKRAEQLETSNKELESFAYIASHDLQEPLRMVSSFLKLLEKKYKGQLDDTANKYIHFAVDGADRMKKLILNLLEYSRVGSSDYVIADTDMNEVMDDVLHTFKSALKELDATVTVVSSLPVLPNTRKLQMGQLMQNLVGNALKYHGDAKPIITIDVIENESEWVFTVKDNGIGIDQQYSEKIFIIFQRLHNQDEYSGTGVGLSVCKKIVEKHGGKIWVDSSPGEGSTFFFTYPKNTKSFN